MPIMQQLYKASALVAHAFICSTSCTTHQSFIITM